MPAASKHHMMGSNARCTHRPDTALPQWVPLQEPAQQLVLAQPETPQVGQVPLLVLEPPGVQVPELVLLQEAALALARGQPHRPRRI